MSEDADYLLALELQNQLNGEESSSDSSDVEQVDFKPPPPAKQPLGLGRYYSNLDEDYLNRTQNLVHPQWEVLDPTPDVFTLFGAFDNKFFQGRLKCVTLEWSKRMYSCAGICYSHGNRFGKSITIRLSEPLLKLRPRKDLVETMLHEMIHAYCFVLNIREGNGGHGPIFKKIMYSINKVAGTNINVYHTFHDEVEIYKQHWWRCNGSCQNRPPFLGYVKRTCNRAPGPNDQWWAAHHEACGGTFMKIKGPDIDKKAVAANKKVSKSQTNDIRKFFNSSSEKSTKPTVKKGSFTSTADTASNIHTKINTLSNANTFKGPVKSNGGGTMVLNPKTNSGTITTAKPPPSAIAAAFPPTSYPGLTSDPFNVAPNTSMRPTRGPIVPPGGNLRNVKGFRDLTPDGGNAGINQTGARHDMTGQGRILGKPSQAPVNVRDVWSKRFENTSKETTEHGVDFSDAAVPAKRRRVSEDAPSCSSQTKDNHGSSNWTILDDEVMFKVKQTEVVSLLSDDEDEDVQDRNPSSAERNSTSTQLPLTPAERQQAIKQEIIDEMEGVDDDIVLIDDDYDDDEDRLSLIAATEMSDTSIIDEFFGEDTMLKEFNRENDLTLVHARPSNDPRDDIITCPICLDKMKRSVLNEHLDGCTGIAVRVKPSIAVLKSLAKKAPEVQPRNKTKPRRSKKEMLRDAGYSEEDLENIASSASENDSASNSSVLFSPDQRLSSTAIDAEPCSSQENTRRYRQKNLFKTTRQCPVCAQEIEEAIMNAHLDLCLS